MLKKSVRKLNTVKCPYCNSANTVKISTIERGAAIVAFGLASGKVGGKRYFDIEYIQYGFTIVQLGC